MKAGIFNVGLIILALLLTGFIFEGIARVFYAPLDQTMSGFNIRTTGYYKHDKIFGWLPRENVGGEHNRKGKFHSKFKTNSKGLRDTPYEYEKPKGKKRIVVLGDSFTWGFGVNNDEVYTEILESMLKDYDVINFGVAGYSTEQEFLYLKMEAMKYNPDIVLLSFCLNDIYDTEFEEFKRIGDHESNVEGEKKSKNDGKEGGQNFNSTNLFWMVKDFLSHHSVFYRFVVERINTNKDLVKILVALGIKGELEGLEGLSTNLVPALVNYPKEFEEALERTQAKLVEMQEYLNNKGIRFILVLIPSVQSVDEKAFRHSLGYSQYDEVDFDLEKPYRKIVDFAKRENIEIINPIDVFRKISPDGKKLFLPNDMHFNPLGHKVFAEQIFRFLVKNHNNDL